MMLENMKNMLEKAKKEKYAVPHLNINNLEWAKYILEECQELNSPVILGVSEGAAKYMGGYNVISGMVNGLLKDLNITIPVALHLDHGSSFETCKKAIDAGFSSVMIDGSKLNLEDNIKVTKEVITYAESKNVSVEAEIGCIGGSEDGVSNEILHAKTEDCVKIVNETNLCTLAPALGSVHGIYKGEPNLNFERMKEISEKTNLPLVLHGGTGIPDDKIKMAISCGISKINVNTELQLAWHGALKNFVLNNDAYDPRKVIGSGELAIKEAIKAKVILFGSNNKA
ncbi:MAG: class II fructose-1,6-bisphosphate aldolase [Bacilli bacterium]|nr:class II fructose-1,6-bisphosphate aldolase [Bacilli bacterium]